MAILGIGMAVAPAVSGLYATLKMTIPNTFRIPAGTGIGLFVAEHGREAMLQLSPQLAADLAAIGITIAGVSIAHVAVSNIPAITDAVSFSLGNQGGGDLPQDLTRSQRNHVETMRNTIRDHLTEDDFSGTLRELNGERIPKGNGLYWDHINEMRNSHTSLIRARTGLEGSLQNPNMDPTVRNFLQGEVNRATHYINRIENLFRPFGGI